MLLDIESGDLINCINCDNCFKRFNLIEVKPIKLNDLHLYFEKSKYLSPYKFTQVKQKETEKNFFLAKERIILKIKKHKTQEETERSLYVDYNEIEILGLNNQDIKEYNIKEYNIESALKTNAEKNVVEKIYKKICKMYYMKTLLPNQIEMFKFYYNAMDIMIENSAKYEQIIGHTKENNPYRDEHPRYYEEELKKAVNNTLYYQYKIVDKIVHVLYQNKYYSYSLEEYEQFKKQFK